MQRSCRVAKLLPIGRRVCKMCFRGVTECLSQLTGGGVDGAHHGNGENRQARRIEEARKADEALKAAQAEQAESAVRVGQGPATD